MSQQDVEAQEYYWNEVAAAQILGWISTPDGEWFKPPNIPTVMLPFHRSYDAICLLEDALDLRGVTKAYIEALATALGITAETVTNHSASALWMTIRATLRQRRNAALAAIGVRVVYQP